MKKSIKKPIKESIKKSADRKPYPDDPGAHMFELRHKRRKTIFDGSYSYECNNFFFLVFALLIRTLALVVIPVWAKATSGYRISGRQNLRKVRGSGVVIIANHVHHLDAPLICGCVNRFRKTRIISLGENFDIPVVGRLIRALGAIPLGGDFAGRQKFNETIEKLLKKKKHVLFFAEGALWPYYKGIRPFRSGGFRFAARLGVPVLPVVIVFESTEGGRRERLRLHVGRPLMPEEGAGVAAAAAALRERTLGYFRRFTSKYYGIQDCRRRIPAEERRGFFI